MNLTKSGIVFLQREAAMRGAVSKSIDTSIAINENIELKLRWGTFCKAVALEPGTNETTVIGILPALKIAAQVLTGLDEKLPIYLPIPLWLHVSFICKNNTSEAAKLNLEMALSISEQIHKEIVPVTIAPAEVSSILNLRINTPNGIPLYSGLQILKATFTYNGKNLGAIELPISVDVVSAQRIPEVKQ